MYLKDTLPINTYLEIGDKYTLVSFFWLYVSAVSVTAASVGYY